MSMSREDWDDEARRAKAYANSPAMRRTMQAARTSGPHERPEPRQNMTITAKFPGTCPSCSQPISAGQRRHLPDSLGVAVMLGGAALTSLGLLGQLHMTRAALDAVHADPDDPNQLGNAVSCTIDRIEGTPADSAHWWAVVEVAQRDWPAEPVRMFDVPGARVTPALEGSRINCTTVSRYGRPTP